MEEKFVDCLLDGIVKENLTMYKEILDTPLTEVTDKYWQEVITLYNSVDKDKKLTIIEIFKQVMIDTISNILGIIDGNVSLGDFEHELKLRIDDVEVEDSLQDTFLESAELI